ncbi:MAG: hypothetical protein KAJ51_16825 [Thermoplasmata archaeon]|nr:hypothetical protein [Thermoplasmata archaeon]
MAGLALAFLSTTGVSLDPNDHLIDATGAIVKQSEGATSIPIWESMKIYVYLMGLIAVIADVILIIKEGPLGILNASLGFLGGFFMILYPQAGVWLFLVGAVMAGILSKE